MSNSSDVAVRQRLGPISTKLHILFRRYLQDKVRPSVFELQDAGFKFAVTEETSQTLASAGNENVEATNFASFCTALEPLTEPLDLSKKCSDGQPAPKKAKTSSKNMTNHSILERFRAWGERMALNDDGHLILKDAKGITKSDGKVILPVELFEKIVMDIHTQNNLPGVEHRSFMDTVARFGEKFTMGRRQFGIAEDKIKHIIDKCTFADCSRKKAKKSKGAGKKTQLSPKKKSPEPPPKENPKAKKKSKSHSRSNKSKPLLPAPPNVTVGVTPGSFIMGRKDQTQNGGGSKTANGSQPQVPFTCYQLVMTATGYQAVPTTIASPLALLNVPGTATDTLATSAPSDSPVNGKKSSEPPAGESQTSLTRSGSLTDISHQHFALEKKLDGSLFWKPIQPTVPVEPGRGTTTSFTMPCSLADQGNTPTKTKASADIITPNFQIHRVTPSTSYSHVIANQNVATSKKPAASKARNKQDTLPLGQNSHTLEERANMEADSSIPEKKKKKKSKKSKRAKKDKERKQEEMKAKGTDKELTQFTLISDIDVNNNSPMKILPFKGLPTLQRAPIISATVGPMSQPNRGPPPLIPCLPTTTRTASLGGGEAENHSMLKSYLILPGTPTQAIPLDTLDISSLATNTQEEEKTVAEELPDVEPWEDMSPEDLMYKYYPTYTPHPAPEPSSTDTTGMQSSATYRTSSDRTATETGAPGDNSDIDPEHKKLMEEWSHLMTSITCMKRHIAPSCLEAGSKSHLEALKREIEYSEVLITQVRSLLVKDIQDWSEDGPEESDTV